MKPARLIGLIALTMATAITVVVAGQAQTATVPAVTKTPVSTNNVPVEIVRHKIGSEYYPMLDRPNSMSAENGELPMTEAERLARQRIRSNNKNATTPEDKRSRVRSSSYIRVIDDAQLVQVVVKNSESKTIKSVDWDFAFPRYENGLLLSRLDVTTKVEIKPGGKKTLKYKLPAGAKKCEVIKVVSDQNQPEKVNTFEAVCGTGFHDPSLLKQKQETISIKRIEYVDGTIWQRP